MSFKWRDQHMPVFLEAYQRQECLWNNKCSDYSKANVRQKAYSSMLTDLKISGLTTADIKLKIKTIRTRYGAELTKIRSSERSGAGVDDVYEPRLFWFKDADAFLRNVCAPRPSSSNLQESGSNNSRGEDSTSGRTTDVNTQQSEQPQQRISHVEDCDSPSPECTQHSAAPLTPNIDVDFVNGKKARKRSASTCILQINDAQFKEILDNNNEPRNEFDVFCECLAIQLKKMPLDRALICQEKLLNVMTQERLSQLPARPNPPIPSNPTTYEYLLASDS